METLQEYVDFTKFWEYAIVVMLIIPGFAFWAFWKWSGRGDRSHVVQKTAQKGPGSRHQ